MHLSPWRSRIDSMDSGQRRHSRSATGTLLWIGVVCVVIAGICVALPHQVARQLSLSFTRQPTPFTELYFPHPRALPISLTVTHPTPFSFKVVNHEGADRVYPYVVQLISAQDSSTIAQGRLRIANDRGVTTTVDILPPHSDTEYEVRVTLPGRPEVIHFRAVSES
jgi:hypothetical protein